MGYDSKDRCEWCGSNEIYIAYHDDEWGVPVHDDNHLFEMITLEGAQAGLSWFTVLKRRQSYRELFDNFDPKKIANYNEAKLEDLVQNPGIIRNRKKILSTRTNAKAFLQVQDEFGSFDNYIWQFVNHNPIQNSWRRLSELPSKTPISDQMSKDLKKRGFSFMGSTICYALMQSIGMVNDHLIFCFRHQEVKNLS